MSCGRKFAWIIWDRERKSSIRNGSWSYIERSERWCIRDRSGFCRAERGLVNRKDGGRSGKAGSERGWIRNIAWIKRELIGDGYDLHCERVIFLPIISDQSIKSDWYWSEVGRLSGGKVAEIAHTDHMHPPHIYKYTCKCINIPSFVAIFTYQYTRGIWKVMHIHLYNFTQWSEKKDEGISVNVRIWGFWGYYALMFALMR